MYRFRNILFSPLEGIEHTQALQQVADLALRNDARLTVFGAIDQPSRLQRIIRRPELDAAVEAAQRQQLLEELALVTPGVDESNIETVVEVGNPALAIIQRVLSHEHDLVIVADGHETVDRNTVTRLLRKCPCPVWIIRPTGGAAQRVLAAVDPLSDEPGMNHMILELAASMVKLFGGELHVGHAWELYGESIMRGSNFMPVPVGEIEALLEEGEAEARRSLDELVASSLVADAPWEVHLQKGPPADVVCRLVEELDINLLVMGTVGRSGMSGALMGNTADLVLQQVRCSLIALKPPGFVSPIKAPPA